MPLGCPNHLQAVEHIAWLSKLSRMYWQYGNMGKTKDSRKHPVSVVLWKSARHVGGNSLQVWSSQSTLILWFDENGAFNRRLLCWKLLVFKPKLSRKTTNAPSSEDATYEEVDSVWGSPFLRHARDLFFILRLWICPPKITYHIVLYIVSISIHAIPGAWQHYRCDVDTPQSAERKLLRWWNHVQLQWIRCSPRALQCLQKIESKKSRQLEVVMILQIITLEMILH